MEKVNAKLSTAVEDVTLEHCKKNEVPFPVVICLFPPNLTKLCPDPPP